MLMTNQRMVGLSLSYTDDGTFEGDKQVVLVIGPTITGGMLGSPSRHVANLLEDETVTASFVSASSTVAENTDSTHTVGVSVSPAVSVPLTLNYMVQGDAASGLDYRTLSGSVTVPANMTGTIDINIIDDVSMDGGETIVLTLTSDRPSVAIGATATHTVTIADDDGIVLEFASAELGITEGERKEALIRFTRAPGENLPVKLAVANVAGPGEITAAEDADYTLSGRGLTADATAGQYTLVLPPDGNRGDLPGLGFNISAASTSADEGTQRFRVTLLAGTGYELGGQTTLIVDISERAPVPIVGFGAAAGQVLEVAGGVTVSVPFDQAHITGSNVSVNVEVVAAEPQPKARITRSQPVTLCRQMVSAIWLSQSMRIPIRKTKFWPCA